MADFYNKAKKYPQFTKEDVDVFIEAFKQYDQDGNGSIDIRELGNVLRGIGQETPDSELKKQIAEVDSDNSGTVDFGEFLDIINGLTKGKSTSFGQTIAKTSKGVQKIVTASGGSHSFSEEEKVSFAEHINNALKDNPLCKGRLPIDPNTDDLFKRVGDGVILCCLINDAVKDTIDVRVINNKDKMTTFMHTENLNLAINSAKAIGCSVVNVGAQDIQQGTQHIILGLIWQIVRIGLLSSITLANHPELFRLLEPGEDLNDLLKLSPEQILLRWFNYHLKKANHPRKVNNFGGDIKDSECYTILLNQLAPEKCDKSALNETDLTKRATKVLDNADKLGCKKFVKPNDIVKGNPKLNLAFVANLFNTIPGLEPLSEEEKAALDEFLFSSEGTREARQFALWINSLGIDPFVNNLFTDLRDGIIILKVMDIVQPGIVDWGKVNVKLPLSKFKKLENCNYAVTIGKQMKFSLVGIGGVDIEAGTQTLTLALVWQLMRAHVLSILKGLGENVDEEKMVKWANEQVAGSGKSTKMGSFKDPSLRNSHFFLDLLNSIRKCVNYDLVTPGDADEDAMQNAKYTISIARKIGCTIFLLPEDIIEVKPKMILTLIGTIMAVAKGKN